jgi:hypothetical protein
MEQSETLTAVLVFVFLLLSIATTLAIVTLIKKVMALEAREYAIWAVLTHANLIDKGLVAWLMRFCEKPLDVQGSIIKKFEDELRKRSKIERAPDE